MYGLYKVHKKYVDGYQLFRPICVNLTHFFRNATFPYPVKTSENFKVFWYFSEGRERMHWEHMG